MYLALQWTKVTMRCTDSSYALPVRTTVRGGQKQNTREMRDNQVFFKRYRNSTLQEIICFGEVYIYLSKSTWPAIKKRERKAS